MLWHRYTYYLMATLFTDQRTKRKYLWWGRYLTQFQARGRQLRALTDCDVHCSRETPQSRFLSTTLVTMQHSSCGDVPVSD